MWKIWVRDSFRSKWRMINTRDFRDYWEADIFIDRSLDLGKEGEGVALLEGETPFLKQQENYHA